MYAKFLLLLSTVFVLTACSDSSGPDFKDGKWSITTTTEMEGMPFKMPTQTFTTEQCMTAEDRVPHQQDQDGSECKIVEQSVKGSTVAWKVVCSNSKGSGSITYGDEAFDGTMNVESDSPMGPMKMKSTMKGRYLGPCN